MQAPLASADRRSAARGARVKEPARRREPASAATSTTRPGELCEVSRGPLARDVGGWQVDGAERERGVPICASRRQGERNTERESAREGAGKSPGNSANVSRGPPEGLIRAPQGAPRGAERRLKGLPGTSEGLGARKLRNLGQDALRAPRAVGRQRQRRLSTAPIARAEASTRAAEGRRGAASGASPARRYAVSNRRYRRDRARRPDRPFSDRCQGARCVFVWASDQ